MSRFSKALCLVSLLVFTSLPSAAWAFNPAEAFASILEKAAHARTSPEASIRIIEPAWPGNTVVVTPGDAVEADPRILNDGNTAFSEAAMEVSIPLCLNGSGIEIPAVELEIPKNSKWKACGAIRLDDASGTGASGGTGAALSYRFVYDSKIPVDSQTPPPYEGMNVAEGIDESLVQTVAIGIRAIAISEDGYIAEDDSEGAQPIVRDERDPESSDEGAAATFWRNPGTASGIGARTGTSALGIIAAALLLAAAGASLRARSQRSNGGRI